jgi:hypothetical protein
MSWSEEEEMAGAATAVMRMRMAEEFQREARAAMIGCDR